MVEVAIQDHCKIRGWDLRAANVRTNHVHAVVACGEIKPEPVMEQFKAWATRRLREARMFLVHLKIWAKHGSTEYLWYQKDVDAAIRYVIEMQ